MRLKAYITTNSSYAHGRSVHYTPIHTVHNKTSTEEQKLRQKNLFCVIFIHCHVFWNHVVITLPFNLKNVIKFIKEETVENGN